MDDTEKGLRGLLNGYRDREEYMRKTILDLKIQEVENGKIIEELRKELSHSTSDELIPTCDCHD